MTHVHRADLQGTAGTYTSTAGARGASVTAIPRTDAPYIRRTAEASPQEAELYISTDAPQGASAILYPAAAALQREAETYQSAGEERHTGKEVMIYVYRLYG